MSDPTFPLITDLSLDEQTELIKIQAIPAEFRSAQQTAYLNARLPYTQNFILANGIKKGAIEPVRAKALASIIFSGNVADGELVTIGTDVYEFDTNSSVAAGHIKVDVSAAQDDESAAAALITAISSGTEPVSAGADGSTGVTIRATNFGPAANFIAVSTTCANGSWNTPTLTGGQFSILAKQLDVYFDTTEQTLWIALNDITDPNSDGWNEFNILSND